MRAYRLVDADDVVVADFEADSDELAAEKGRATVERSLRQSRVFAVQRAAGGQWIEVMAWVPRPRGGPSWQASAHA